LSSVKQPKGHHSSKRTNVLRSDTEHWTRRNCSCGQTRDYAPSAYWRRTVGRRSSSTRTPQGGTLGRVSVGDLREHVRGGAPGGTPAGRPRFLGPRLPLAPAIPCSRCSARCAPPAPPPSEPHRRTSSRWVGTASPPHPGPAAPRWGPARAARKAAFCSDRK